MCACCHCTFLKHGLLYFYVLQDHFEAHTVRFLLAFTSRFVYFSSLFSLLIVAKQLTNNLSVEEKETQLMLLSAE